MKLGNILSTAATPVVHRVIKFRVLGMDEGGHQVSAQAEAALAFVSEDERHESQQRALEYLRRKPENKGYIHPAIIESEEVYWFLMSALRDKDDATQQFCMNDQYPVFRRALIAESVNWIKAQYDQFVKDEYPELATPEQQAEIQGEAIKNS